MLPLPTAAAVADAVVKSPIEYEKFNKQTKIEIETNNKKWKENLASVYT